MPSDSVSKVYGEKDGHSFCGQRMLRIIDKMTNKIIIQQLSSSVLDLNVLLPSSEVGMFLYEL
jgi:hypothetical protein